jgi:hypothetical protein
MTITADYVSAPPRADLSTRSALIFIAGAASLGAGAIHAAAIGVHAENRPAALAFTFMATLQLTWGVLALFRASRVVVWSGLALGAGSVLGWAVAKSSGISFIAGLDVAEPIQMVDALAAGLAFATVLLLGFTLLAGRSATGSTMSRTYTAVAVATVAVLSVYGMAAAGAHVHSHGTGGTGGTGGAGDDHAHADAAVAAAAAGSADSMPGMDHSHTAAVAPVPYDPTKPIDLGGVPGVTPQQQAAAENLVAVTLLRLPKWSDYKVAQAAGFVSIGDGLTGTEHFINQANMDDDTILDPDLPESLVYDVSAHDGTKKLVAAMYMLKRGTPLAEAPNVGGALMQWHVHNNLCYGPNGKIAGLTDAQGNCRPGTVKPVETPMIHVWIESHKCGPFAALEGIGGGNVPAGETKLCDHVHSA